MKMWTSENFPLHGILLIGLKVVSFPDFQYGTRVLTGNETFLKVKGHCYCYNAKEFFLNYVYLSSMGYQHSM